MNTRTRIALAAAVIVAVIGGVMLRRADGKKPPFQPPPRFQHARFHDVDVDTTAPTPIEVSLHWAPQLAAQCNLTVFPPDPMYKLLIVDDHVPPTNLAGAGAFLHYDDAANGPQGVKAVRLTIDNLVPDVTPGTFKSWKVVTCMPSSPGTSVSIRVFDASFVLTRSTDTPGQFDLETTIYYTINTQAQNPADPDIVTSGMLRAKQTSS